MNGLGVTCGVRLGGIKSLGGRSSGLWVAGLADLVGAVGKMKRVAGKRVGGRAPTQPLAVSPGEPVGWSQALGFRARTKVETSSCRGSTRDRAPKDLPLTPLFSY